MGFRYSCVVPVYNEEGALPRLETELLPVLRGLGEPFELILVDDGSTDGSPALLREMLSRVPECVVYRLDRNHGLTSALDAGFRAARGDIVLSLDSDLQNDPADLPLLIAELDTADMVLGWRHERKDPVLKRISSTIANAVRNRLSGEEIHDINCPLKVFRREILDRVKLFNGMHRFLPTLARLEGFTVTEVKVAHRKRTEGRSKYGVWNRLFKGISDLRAVRWMKKNTLTYKATRVEP